MICLRTLLILPTNYATGAHTFILPHLHTQAITAFVFINFILSICATVRQGGREDL